MNTLSGAEALVAMLRRHSVDTVFGLCGDTSLPFYDALYRTGRDIRHVLARDERSAAYMADGYARVTGKVGVCEGPSGGGATYILPGLAEANESSIPVLAITSDISVQGRGRFTLTELDQEALFRPVTKWNAMAHRADTLPALVREAFRAMTTGRPGAAHLGLPFDVQNQPVDETDIHGEEELGRFPARRAGPDPDAIGTAADLLAAAERPLVLCGGGPVIAGAETALARLARRLGAPVATTISGQGAIPETDPHALGVVGSNGGTIETREVIDSADVLLAVGVRMGSVTTERWRHPEPGRTKVIHLDADGATIGVNYPTDVAIVADARLGLEALDTALMARGMPSGDFAGAARAAKARKQARFKALAQSGETPIRPERLVMTLRRLLDDDATLVLDPGTPCPYFSAYYEIRQAGRRLFSNRAHGALGYSFAAALGAHVGRPDVKTVAVMGDGSFGFTAGELETAVRLAAPVTFVVVSNSAFGWIKAGQRHGYGGRFYSVDFSRTDHAAVAAAYGVKSWRVEDPEALEAVLAKALAESGPSLVDVITQPLDEAAAPVSEWIA